MMMRAIAFQKFYCVTRGKRNFQQLKLVPSLFRKLFSIFSQEGENLKIKEGQQQELKRRSAAVHPALEYKESTQGWAVDGDRRIYHILLSLHKDNGISYGNRQLAK